MAPDGFNQFGTNQALSLASGGLYYVRIFYVASGEHSPVASFTALNCDNQNPSLSITKMVRNVTQGGGETDTVSARPYDTVEFTLRVRNDGNANANNVRVWDSLPAGLTYVSGDQLDTNLGTRTPGQSETIRFRVTVREDSYFNQGTTTLTNIAYANANNISTVQDSAWVNVQRDQQNQPTIFIDKLVRNVTNDSGEMNTVFVRKGDTVEFVIRVTTSGNTSTNNLRVWDTLPTGLTYVSGDNLTGSGLNLGSAYGNRSFTLRFRARVDDTQYASSYYNQTLTNVAYASADNIGTVSDSAYITVNSDNLVLNYQITIQKTGYNISKGESQPSTNVQAAPNDTLDFFIHVRNTSSVTMYNVVVRDALPNGIQYIANTTSVNGTQVADGITGSGINVGTLYPNQEAIIRLNGVVTGASYFSKGVTSLTNTAYTRADNFGEIYAQLAITIYNGSVLGGMSNVPPTGAGDLTAITFGLGAVLTMFYMAYTKTGIFRKREALSIIGKVRADKDKFNFV